MCETEAVLVSPSLVLLVGAGYCIYRVHTEKKVGHHSEIKSQSPCKIEYKHYCSNDECYYLVDEDIVGYNCSWWYGGQRCEKYIWWD